MIGIAQGAKMQNPTVLESTAQTLQSMAQDLHLRAEALALREKLTLLLEQMQAEGEILSYQHLERDYNNPVEVVFYLPWELFRERQRVIDIKLKINALELEHLAIAAYARFPDE
jgi:hypothetical protein